MSTRRLAATSATFGFFVLAIVGWFSGNSMFVCAVRALVGAVVVYVVVAVAARIAVGIIVDAIVRSAPRGKAPEDNAR